MNQEIFHDMIENQARMVRELVIVRLSVRESVEESDKLGGFFLTIIVMQNYCITHHHLI